MAHDRADAALRRYVDRRSRTNIEAPLTTLTYLDIDSDILGDVQVVYDFTRTFNTIRDQRPEVDLTEINPAALAASIGASLTRATRAQAVMLMAETHMRVAEPGGELPTARGELERDYQHNPVSSVREAICAYYLDRDGNRVIGLWAFGVGDDGLPAFDPEPEFLTGDDVGGTIPAHLEMSFKEGPSERISIIVDDLEAMGHTVMITDPDRLPDDNR